MLGSAHKTYEKHCTFCFCTPRYINVQMSQRVLKTIVMYKCTFSKGGVVHPPLKGGDEQVQNRMVLLEGMVAGLVQRVGQLEAVVITHQLAFDEIVFRTKRCTTANLCVG